MFSKRFLQSDAYKKAVAVGRPVFTEFGTKSYPDPCKNLFSRLMSSLVSPLPSCLMTCFWSQEVQSSSGSDRLPGHCSGQLPPP
jgi:hypothetical protein